MVERDGQKVLVFVVLIVALLFGAFVIFPGLSGPEGSVSRNFFTTIQESITNNFFINQTQLSMVNGTFLHEIDAGPGSNWNCLLAGDFVNFTVNGVLFSKTKADGSGLGSLRTFGDPAWDFPVGQIIVSNYTLDAIPADDLGSMLISNSGDNILTTVTTLC